MGDSRSDESPLRLTSALLNQIRSGADIAQLVPERPLPEWVKKHKKSSAVRHAAPSKSRKPAGARSGLPDDSVDANNMRKAWKSAQERVADIALAERARELSNPEPIRDFPFSIRPSKVLEDSPVALYARSRNTRKVFSNRPLPAAPVAEPARNNEPEAEGIEAAVAVAVNDVTPRSEDSTRPPDLADLDYEESEEVQPVLLVDDPAFLKLDQSQMPLQMFDSNDFIEIDRSPEAWLATGCEAQAPFYRDGHWIWRKCQVHSYDPATELFEITFLPRSEPKRVCRFNLLFDAEDKAVWERRRVAASRLREETKERLRFSHFVSVQPSEQIMPISRQTLKGIYEKIAEGLPQSIEFPTQGTEMGHLLRLLTADAIQRYTKALKASVVFHQLCRDPVMARKYVELKLPALPPPPPPPLYGKVQIPPHDFLSHAKHVAQIHYSNKRQVLGIFTWLYANWDVSFSAFSYMDTTPENSLALPCQLEDFKRLQHKHALKMLDKLGGDWRRALIEQLVDHLQEVYDLFQSNLRFFQQSALFRLFKHLELRMAAQLRQVVTTSVASWLGFVSRSCLDYDGSRPPLFDVRLVVKKGEVTIEPSPHEIMSALSGMLDELVTGVRSLQTIDSTLMALLHLQDKPIFPVGLGDPSCTDVDAVLADVRAKVLSLTEEAMTGPLGLASRYGAYVHLVGINTEEFVDEFEASDPGAFKDVTDDPFLARFLKYRAKVQQLHDAAEAIERESFDQEFFALMRVETSKVKGLLAAKAMELRDALLGRLVVEIREHNHVIIQRYEQILARISQRPKNEEELAALKEFMAKSKEDIARIMTEAAQVRNQIDLLGEFRCEIPQEEKFLAWSIIEYPRKIEATTKEVEESLEEDKVRMMDKLALEKERFDALLEKFQLDVKRAKVHSDYDAYEAITEEVNALQDAINDAKAKAEDFNAREKVFGFPPTDYPILNKIEEDLQPFYKLWNMIYDFHTSRKEWMLGQFLELDGKKIEDEVTDWWKSSYRFAKTMEEQFPGAAGCAMKLREETNEFRQHLPVIQSLASPALKARHWELLSERIGQEIEPDEELTLKGLLDMDVGRFIDQIQEVCVAAKKEYDLETALANMKAEWAAVSYEVLPYRTTGTFVVSGVDDIISLLDDHLAKTQTMRTSPFIKPIEAVCKDWEFRLKYAQGLLDEWIKCQRTWMYLEPIFGSEDIMRQLPTEARRFNAVDALWRKTMADTNQDPAFMVQCDPEKKLKDKFQAANLKLDEIQKGLSDYLEMKRLYFPRFFFLSNDELLEILSQTKEPRAVQPHLNKAFEGIAKVKFETDLKITEMISAQGETVKLNYHVDPESGANKGNVEKWLLELERVQWESIKTQTEKALAEYPTINRTQWTLRWPAQVVLGVSQVFWTQDVVRHIKSGGSKALGVFIEELNAQLKQIVQLVRGKLSKGDRSTLGALVVIDVHARDVIQKMVDVKVESENDFEWVSQLRYYWQPSWKDGQAVKAGDKTLVARIVNAKCLYGYEYLGNTVRLVITPLTDRCYRTMIGAIDLLYGGAPEGPAGTGKTETVKDLSKAVAIQCVVFNCSDGLDYLAMAKFFKGLAGCGSWCCFDEFNRINIEVLSVIAQQILTINKAKKANAEKFHFEGTYMKLNPNANAFITMNPGYAGRAELPDNLKALFRPCAMMVPDYALISEIRLYSFGFEDARANAQKLVRVLQLSSEQLSSQKHYDYGMRAVNSILVAAGNLRQALGDEPEWTEAKIVLRSVNDVNLPKFTVEDLPLFRGITSDLFPGVVLPEANHGALIPAIDEVCQAGVTVAPDRTHVLQPVPGFTKKVVQLYEMVLVRHGVMICGQTCSGKTAAVHALASAMTLCNERGHPFPKVHIFTMNPKSISSGQLYGNFDDNTHEWSDGILAVLYRNCAKDTSPDRNWVMFDGPVDAVWIENMNTVLDDNKKLCLMSGEIIKMTDVMTMMFEAEDLEQASPATVSRVGMIFCETRNLGWQPLRHVWLERLSQKERWGDMLNLSREFLHDLFDWLIPPAVYFVQKHCAIPTPVTTQEMMFSCLRLMDCLLDSPEGYASDVPKVLECLFIMAIVWSVGACTDSKGRVAFNAYLRALLNSQGLHDNPYHLDFLSKNRDWHLESRKAQFPPPEERSLYDYKFDAKKGQWAPWMDASFRFAIPKDAPFNSIVVPTIDTIRNEWLLETLILHNFNVLCTGDTGTGKSVSVKSKLLTGLGGDKYTSIFLNFSAQTGANQTQDIIDNKLDKRRKGVLGPPLGMRCVIFVDDLNMPAKEVYGAQPPIEILRQWMDHAGWYNREENSYVNLVDIQFVAAMGPPGGGRTRITQRYVRHFNLINFVPFSDESLGRVFGTILDWFLNKGFPGSIKSIGANMVAATVAVYNQISENLLPTPAKSHYTFNLRDISKVFQGILQTVPDVVKDKEAFIRLWFHECLRVFSDRLVSDDDRQWFQAMVADKVKEHFSLDFKRVVTSPDGLVIYGNYIDPKAVNKVYQEIDNPTQLQKVMDDYLEDYNAMTNKPMSLVLFQNAIEHVSRISRIIAQPYGNALLVGVGGSGRKSLTTLAVSVADYKLFQIEISKSYGKADWREDLKKIFIMAGADNRSTVFLFDDTQIVNESFLEDINGILNTGEVPNLFNNEEFGMITESLLRPATEAGVNTGSPAELFAFFINRCRTNLHVVLCLSPIGDAFRTRLRMFPSLVNCCTIDWFTEWPQQALRSVAVHFLDPVEMDQKVKDGVVEVCVDMQEKASQMSRRFLSEMGRHYYVTPTSYLELINTFKSLLHHQRHEVLELKTRYENGLTKLLDTASQVNAMQVELEELQPKLKEATVATDKLLEVIAKDTVVANEKKAVVQKEEEVCNKQAAEATSLKDSCEADLAEAIPILEAAIKALSSLDKASIVEVKAMKKPPDAVKKVMEAVCIMMGVKPDKIKDPDGGNKKIDDYWGPAQKQLLGDARFLQNLMEFDKDHMDPRVVEAVSVYTANPDFDPTIVMKGSVAAAGLCKWVHAMVKYDRVAKIVAPKRAALEGAEKALAAAMANLAEKQAVLQEVLNKLDALNRNLKEAEDKKKNLQDQVTDCANKLRRAKQLINGLGGERTRWTELSQVLQTRYENVTGDIMLSSGVIAYLGCFTSGYRESAIRQWSELLKAKHIPSSAEFSLSATLGEPVKIRSWVIAKLPNDSFSIDNAIMLFKSNRWPLMIDPQGQANRWVKKLEEAGNLKVVKQSQASFVRTIENSIQFGNPVLLENVGESLDPILESVLLKQIVIVGGIPMIKIGDNTVEYDRNFRMYITTKLTNPHYPPELCVKVNLLNFMATAEGLQDQMLGIVVAKEEPELEAQREKLVLEDAENKRQLKEIEDQILYLLKNSKGNILDDEVLIDTLAQSKVTSNNIEEKVKVAAKTQETIARTRIGYMPVAYRVSQLFFCIADLGMIDPMYQYSLEWYINLFLNAIQAAEKSRVLDERLRHLKDAFTYILYVNVCRSLFEKDKLLFSFLLTIKIMTSEGKLDARELRLFLQGNTSMDLQLPNPLPNSWLSDKTWGDILALSALPAFDGFHRNFTSNLPRWEAIFNSPDPEKDIKDMFGDALRPFQLLCVMRCIRPDMVVPAVQNFVANEQGSKFIEPPPFNLKACYSDSICSTPLIFVLTPGADPMSELLKLAEELGFGGKKLTSISLGQGQGPLAENAISEAADKGTWVCLQNCHLSISWMPTLEKLCEELTPDRVHTAFRLWLTSEPSRFFPTYVLQNGVKMTNEPPKGIRANLLGSYYTVEEAWFESCRRPREFKKMLFGLCFFHATVRERRKFGPLGWNIQYVFSGPDLKISMDQLKIFLDDLGPTDPVPYPALAYLAGECNYGGRVTDDKDRRALVNILSDFYTPDIQKDDYKFSPSGTYYTPPEGGLESYREYVRTLPHYNAPEVFGLHENANISCALAETNALLNTALSLQPRSSGGGEKSWDQVLLDLSKDILARLPPPYDIEKALLDFPVRYEESMNTVLTQELIRFNTLSTTITKSLKELQRAIKGLVVMSGELEAMGNSMAIGQVPAMWQRVSYPSLKPLGSWVNDFLLRLDFLQKWVEQKEAPTVFWISGFFFTQAFITGTLQNFARKHHMPIDQAAFDFRVLKPQEMRVADVSKAEDGAFIRGLFLEGARWDVEAHAMAESRPRELYVAMPYIHLWARRKDDIAVVHGLPELYTGDVSGTDHVYMTPVYKTSVRQGTLSTTGHSTNFVMFIRVPMSKAHTQKYWIKRGVAMLTQLDD